jgi:hypothetical protein
LPSGVGAAISTFGADFLYVFENNVRKARKGAAPEL